MDTKSESYTIDYYGYNRSAGAALPDVYLPPPFAKVIKNMPKPIDALLRNRIMEFLNLAGCETSEGNDSEAEQALLQAWELLPSPRHEWDFGQLVIQQIISFYLKAERPQDARLWLEPLALSFGSENDGTVAMIAGVVQFESGNLDIAYERFDFLFKNFGKRPFQGRDKKYIDFYLAESKIRKSRS